MAAQRCNKTPLWERQKRVIPEEELRGRTVSLPHNFVPNMSSWEFYGKSFGNDVVDAVLAEWLDLDLDKDAVAAVIVAAAVLVSLFVGWLSWKFVMACQLARKLRRLSRTVPSVR